MLFTLLSVFLFPIVRVYGTADLARDCIEALQAGSITSQCVKAARLKWKDLDSLNSATATQSSCCAMYEALNCLQKSSCNVCPPKDLHDTAQYRIRALLAFGETLCRDTPYNASAELCKLTVEERTPLQQHCKNELQSSTEASSFKGALILGLVMLAILIFVAALGLTIHLMARGAEEGEKNASKQPVPKHPRSGSGIFKLHRSKTFSSGRFLPVRRVPRADSISPKQTSSQPSAAASTTASKMSAQKKQSSAKAESSSKSKKSIKTKASRSSRRDKVSLSKLPSKGSSSNTSTVAKTKDIKK